jgi:hypothetical protein
MICSVAPLIGGFDLSQDQPIGSPLDMSGEWAGSSKRQITSQMPAGRNRKASLPASTRPPTFSAVAALNNTPSVFAINLGGVCNRTTSDGAHVDVTQMRVTGLRLRFFAE